MKVLKWLDDNLELMFSSIFLVGMVISVALQVLSRYLMRSPISWTEESTRYLFIWMVFTSIGITAKSGHAFHWDNKALLHSPIHPTE